MKRTSSLAFLGFAAVALVFIMLVALIIMFSGGVKERRTQHYSAEAERYFFNTMFFYQQDKNRALSYMEENGIDGVGIYGTSRRLIFSLGEVPDDLNGEDYVLVEDALARGRGILINRHKDGKVEFVRSQRTAPQIDRFFDFPLFANPGERESRLEFENTFFIKAAADGYNRSLIVVDIIAAVMILFVCAFFYLSCRIYLKNLEYKEKINKQATLVSLGEAARTLAHEIKNPLGAIMIQTAVLKKTIPDCKAEDIAVIENETRRIKALTDHISDYLRNPVGNPVEIDLCSLVSSLHSASCPDGPLKVMMDPEKARSVFENIINNALETGTPSEEVGVSVQKGKKGTAEVRVTDKGPGFPKEKAEREKLFNAFYTTKVHGSGIGLAICKQFAEAAGGKITLSDREGGGGEVTVILPVCVEAE